MRISKITIGRLYNLGSYEHVRYELTAEIPEGESAGTALIGMEKLLAALSPKTATHSRDELVRERRHLEEMATRLKLPEDEFRRHYGHFEGSPEQYYTRCVACYNDNLGRREAWERRSERARKLLEDLGGAANFKDAKLDWECDDDFDN